MQESNEWVAAAYAELDLYDKRMASIEKQVKNSYVFTTVATNTLCLIPVGIGFVELANGNTDRGWVYIKTGLAITIGVNLVYQGGHWVFKIW